MITMTRRRFGATAVVALVGVPAVTLAGASPVLAETADFVALERESGGRLGVAVASDGGTILAGYRADERFPMCSTFKALAAAAVLARVDRGESQLGHRVTYEKTDLVDYSPITGKHVGGDGMTLAELCAAAITVSDNTAGNLLLAEIGGPDGLTRFARSLDDSVTRLDRIEPSLNEALPGDPRDTTSPAAMARDLHLLVLGEALSPSSRKTLADWLVATTTGGKRIRAGVAADWRVGDKTGTGARGTANDAAVLWPPQNRPPLTLSIYLTGAGGTADAQSAIIAGATRAVGRQLGW